MTHIITSLCLRDRGCIEVCPVECIVPGDLLLPGRSTDAGERGLLGRYLPDAEWDRFGWGGRSVGDGCHQRDAGAFHNE